jgi:hypothetical protein
MTLQVDEVSAVLVSPFPNPQPLASTSGGPAKPRLSSTKELFWL